MIDTVIFDIGNVLASFAWDDYIRRTLKDPVLIEKANDAIRGHGLWDEFDRGVMSKEEIVDGFVSYATDCEREIRLLCEHLGECMAHFDEAIPWVKSVKATGRRVFYLSNYSRDIMADKPDVLDFMPLMDGGVFSCNVHLLKPDRAIYACLCDKYGLEPSHCVFLDDMEYNVKAARDFGMSGIHVKKHEQARAELAALLAE